MKLAEGSELPPCEGLTAAAAKLLIVFKQLERANGFEPEILTGNVMPLGKI